MSIQEKVRRLKLTSLSMHKHAVFVEISPADESLPAEIKEIIKENNLE